MPRSPAHPWTPPKGRKVNVYLPNALLVRLAPYRERINISAVCADALAFKLEQLEEEERERPRLLAILAEE